MTIRYPRLRPLVQPNLRRRSAAYFAGQGRVSTGFSRATGGVPTGPVIDTSRVSFYYSCDWLDYLRPPEIGFGGQLEKAPGSSLLPGVVGSATDAAFPPCQFSTKNNLSADEGTAGFWTRKQVYDLDVNFLYLGPDSTVWRIHGRGGLTELRMRWGSNQTLTVQVPDEIALGEWFFIEFAWSVPQLACAWRINNGDWNDVSRSGAASQPYDDAFLAGSERGDRVPGPMDQVLISLFYKEDLWQYRYSTQTDYPKISSSDVYFYYSCDWTDFGRAPELGDGTQSEAATGTQLVEGVVGGAVDGVHPPIAFPSSNMDFVRGTVGFWFRYRDAWGQDTNMVRIGPDGNVWRVYGIGASDNLRLRCLGGQSISQGFPGGTIGVWYFQEFAWDFDLKELASRSNGNTWATASRPGMVIPEVFDALMTIGSDLSGRTPGPIDQVMISREYQADLYSLRLSREVIGGNRQVQVLDLDQDGRPDRLIPSAQRVGGPIITEDEDSINIDLDRDGQADIAIPKPED